MEKIYWKLAHLYLLQVREYFMHVLADHKRVVSIFRVEVIPLITLWVRFRGGGPFRMRDFWRGARHNLRLLRQIRRGCATLFYDALRFFVVHFIHGLELFTRRHNTK